MKIIFLITRLTIIHKKQIDTFIKHKVYKSFLTLLSSISYDYIIFSVISIELAYLEFIFESIFPYNLFYNNKFPRFFIEFWNDIVIKYIKNKMYIIIYYFYFICPLVV